ncbi:hypothetical protein HOD29_04490 [archaeon]|jgi:hypothetical protein|nr:hypothetical protein [archaeon]
MTNKWQDLTPEEREEKIEQYNERAKSSNKNPGTIKAEEEAFLERLDKPINPNTIFKETSSGKQVYNYPPKSYEPARNVKEFYEKLVYTHVTKNWPNTKEKMDYIFYTPKEIESVEEKPKEIPQETTQEKKFKEEDTLGLPIYNPDIEEEITTPYVRVPTRSRKTKTSNIKDAQINEKNPTQSSTEYSPTQTLEEQVQPQSTQTQFAPKRKSIETIVEEPLEDVGLFTSGFLTGTAPIIDPIGYVCSLTEKIKTKNKFTDDNAVGTFHNKIYNKVYKDKPKTPYIPRVIGNIFGAGAAATGLLTMYLINPILGLSVPALTGIYSLYKTLVKKWRGKKNENNR